MAAINRFTNIDQSQNAYTPRSFEELLKPAAFMRGKHDELLASKAAYDKQIAELDSLGVHDELYQQERAMLDEKLSNITGQLNQEGFSQTAKSNFLDFNKQYQTSVGPKGQLGKIAGAKTAFDAAKEEHLKSAEAAGQSRDMALANFEEHYGAYKGKKGVDSEGNIINIDRLGAPKYIDSLGAFKDNLKQLGYTGSTIKDLAGVKIVTRKDPTTGMLRAFIDTTSSNITNKNNIAQIQSALDATINDISDPNSALAKSNSYNKRALEDEIKRLTAYAGAPVIDATTQQTNRRLTPLSNGESGSGTNSDVETGLVNMGTANSDFRDHTGKVIETSNDLVSDVKYLKDMIANSKDEKVILTSKAKLTQYMKQPELKAIIDKQDQTDVDVNETREFADSFQLGDLYDKQGMFYEKTGNFSEEKIDKLIHQSLLDIPTEDLQSDNDKRLYKDLYNTVENLHGLDALRFIANKKLEYGDIPMLNHIVDGVERLAKRELGEQANKVEQANTQYTDAKLKNYRTLSTSYSLVGNKSSKIGDLDKVKQQIAQKVLGGLVNEGNYQTFNMVEVNGDRKGGGVEEQADQEKDTIWDFTTTGKEQINDMLGENGRLDDVHYVPKGPDGLPELKFVGDVNGEYKTITIQVGMDKDKSGIDFIGGYMDNIMELYGGAKGHEVVQAGNFATFDAEYRDQTFNSPGLKNRVDRGDEDTVKYMQYKLAEFITGKKQMPLEDYQKLSKEQKTAIYNEMANLKIEEI